MMKMREGKTYVSPIKEDILLVKDFVDFVRHFRFVFFFSQLDICILYVHISISLNLYIFLSSVSLNHHFISVFLLCDWQLNGCCE